MYLTAIAGAVLLWSTSFPVIRWALFSVDPAPLVATRFLVATLGALAVLPVLGKSFSWQALRDPWVWLLGSFTAFGFALQFFGQNLTSASMAAVFVNAYVLFVALGAPLVGERPGLRVWLGVILGFAGALLASGGFDLSSAHTLGNLLCLGSALAFAGYVLLSKKLVARWGALELTLLGNGVAAVFLLPFFALGGVKPLTLSVGAYLGLFCTLLPFLLYLWSLKRLPAVTSSVMLLGEVALAVLWSFLFLGERLSPSEALGSLLVLAAIPLAGRG